MAKERKRRPAYAEKPSNERVPVIAPDPGILNRQLRFRFHRVDVGSDWCLTKITEEDWADLLGHIKDFEEKPVKEVFNGRLGKDEDVAGDCPNGKAQARAKRMFPDDNIASLRFSNTKRLWGLRYENEFHVIWWDPKHKVWPSPKKHT